MLTLSPAASTFLYFLRFLAAQAVLFGHLIHSHQQYLYLAPPNLPYVENIAVVFFFLISGLLIPLSTFSKKQVGDYRFANFFAHRFFRIYSVFLPAIILVIILDGLSIVFHPEVYRYAQAFNLKTLITNLLMLQYFPSISLGSGRPFWALPLLWWAYLSFGWLTLAPKVIKKQPLIFFLVLTFFSIIPIYSLFAGRGKGLVAVWLLGVLIFFILSKNTFSKLKSIIAYPSGIIFWLLAMRRVWQTKVEYELTFFILLALGFYFIIAGLQSRVVKTSFSLNKLFRWLSGYSLTLYLTHYTVNAFILLFINSAKALNLVIFSFICSNLIAIILAHFFERRQWGISFYEK
ncbi:MAG: Acyltransferase 3 [Candidatus Beckwithbacteria bacterium GW2011_GWB1_47_15]|uniref:Acyltransferase 3 n=1 Tax=Candidatus Beckwithbacteria bacterium GW2011_GWB1_47_15 TaxID=1618371 RepID=A0A0G1RUQ2_9BACT|nr:MAG: acyltransferase 3 [Candidatus Beckwithbacteria bacterium GW2011_GWC1_49_16]KKU35683.1 MAG: Acyltransferase 3 [Candidatus Beckwithbacteria bacterium GW2011_GWA1_46_30]KKU60882.1 MAG: Acyltransferase 3 [Candidatus Beckwithbacteria bacterium GW2011_GWB1_47_15]KKU72242.1 MAG: Acyltransferase 3 [Candidatus Beckwithbacteria bacterium GW2011_GWA2_47_25]KKW04998.1 MAG: Acyltransferase 3 [Candidatus Beckwithbacteria bacterium GW2011_GWC2_49_11]OGD48947.1 MAG: hypothetical protein A2877_01280 [C